jgi:outer membrane murein-binding lipoprotein Lpp
MNVGGSMDQDVVSSIAAVVTSLETWVRSHPEEVIEGLIASLILALCGLLLALRSSGKHKEQTSKLSARVAQLEDQIQALKEDRSVAPVVAARVEEAAAAPPAAPATTRPLIISVHEPINLIVLRRARFTIKRHSEHSLSMISRGPRLSIRLRK